MNVTQLLSDMYPRGIPPAEYGAIVVLITRMVQTASSPPPMVRLTPSPAAAPKAKRPAPRKASTLARPRGRPPTGTSTKDRMHALLQSRGAMTLAELSKELGVHTGTVYLAIREGGAERFEQDGETYVRATGSDVPSLPQLTGAL